MLYFLAICLVHVCSAYSLWAGGACTQHMLIYNTSLIIFSLVSSHPSFLPLTFLYLLVHFPLTKTLFSIIFHFTFKCIYTMDFSYKRNHVIVKYIWFFSLSIVCSRCTYFAINNQVYPFLWQISDPFCVNTTFFSIHFWQTKQLF